MHELYLKEKQSLITVTQEKDKLQTDISNKGDVNMEQAYKKLMEQSNQSDLKYEMKQKEEMIEQLNEELAQIKTEFEQKFRMQAELESKLGQAVLKMEGQRDMIKNLKLEQRVMAGVLHRVGAEYCFSSRGGYDRSNTLGRNDGQLPNQ